MITYIFLVRANYKLTPILLQIDYKYKFILNYILKPGENNMSYHTQCHCDNGSGKIDRTIIIVFNQHVYDNYKFVLIT